MIYFYNPGEIEIRGATIAGLSVKESDSAIGYFGTGLKYSIACILRWGGKISVFSGNEKFEFFTKSLNFRGQEFDQIFMKNNNEETALGFTTEYGKNWEGWQVFRELFSNAKDENGSFSTSDPRHMIGSDLSGYTLIEIKCKRVEEAASLVNEIFILDKNPADTTTYGSVYKNSTDKIYYRGVAVGDHPCMYRYDIANYVKLTEDRTVYDIYSYRAIVAKMVMLMTNEEIIYNILSHDEDLEKHLVYQQYNGYSPQFMDCARRYYKTKPTNNNKVYYFLKDNDPNFESISVVSLSSRQESVLEKAVSFCQRIEAFSDSNWPELKVGDLGQSGMGMYDAAKNTIWIDKKALDAGSKYATSTLYEELTHWRYGHSDCTYAMQTHLFDVIISLHEELKKEYL